MITQIQADKSVKSVVKKGGITLSEDAIQKLVQGIENAMADGKMSVFEILRIIGDLIRVLNSFLTKKG